MLHLSFLVLPEYKTGEGGIAVVGLNFEFSDVSDKLNFKRCLKFMLGFLISLQGFQRKRKMSLTRIPVSFYLFFKAY